MDRVRSSRRLSAGMLEQLRRRVSPQTGEPGEQRVTGGLGQVPGRCQALCQPHHQAEVSSKEGVKATFHAFIFRKKGSIYNTRHIDCYSAA